MSRSSGVLLAVSSLPSKYGIGCFSREAYEFVDWLESAGQKFWQILPLGTTGSESYDSPYQAYSAFAGNPFYIDLEDLIQKGLLSAQECDLAFPECDENSIDYELLHKKRNQLLRTAYEHSNIYRNEDYQDFAGENAWWLNDYAMFMALKTFFDGNPWKQWPEDIRMHWGFAVDYYSEKLYFEIEYQKFLQYTFFCQWKALKQYANRKGIQIIGDVPIYVSDDSADVWAHPELFQLDTDCNPTSVAGCPPDDFTPDGQLWGNPLYRWEYHRRTGYHWWITRMWYSFQLFDAVRIDHFRGFDEYYSVPAKSKTAKEGHWEKGPGLELFQIINESLHHPKIIAEDLGFITPSVRKLVTDTGYPNMKILQFAFDPKDHNGKNEYLPHNYLPNSVVYTGTHDNETLTGWYMGLSPSIQDKIRNYLSAEDTPSEKMPLCLLNLAMRSTADTCILPLQDILGLGNEARMNTPGTVGNNWQWRVSPDALTPEIAQALLACTQRCGRTGKTSPDQTADSETTKPETLPLSSPELL